MNVACLCQIGNALNVLVITVVMSSIKRGESWAWTLFIPLKFISVSVYWALAVYLALRSALRGLKVKAWFPANKFTLWEDNEHMWSNEAVRLDRVLLTLMLCGPARKQGRGSESGAGKAKIMGEVFLEEAACSQHLKGGCPLGR